MRSPVNNETPAPVGEQPEGDAGPAGRSLPKPKLSVRGKAFVLRRWPYILLFALMAGALAARLVYFSQHETYTTDSYYFLMLARSIRAGTGYTIRGMAHYKYLPGYPLLIALFSYIFRDYAWTAGIIAALGGVFSLLFTYLLGRELFNDLTGLMGAAILAFQPVFFQFSASPMTEGVFTLFFTAGLYYLLTGCRRASPARRLVGAALGGLALVTRVQGGLFLPLAVLVILLYRKEARLKLWEAPVMLGLFAVPLGVFLIRNLIRTGKLTAYSEEYQQNSALTLSLLWQRGKLMFWDTLYVKVLFYLGAAVALFRKWKAFLILFGWFFLFLSFHVFWYYAHPRFLAPAIPAVALLAAYFLYSVGELAWKGLAPAGPVRRALKGRERGKAADTTAAVGRYVAIGLVALAFCFTMYSNVVNTEHETRWQIQQMAGDMGGRAIPKAADYIMGHISPGESVATNVGPYFAWAYGGKVYYLCSVPVGCPFEPVDVEPPDLVDKLIANGVRYLVVTFRTGGTSDLDFPGVPEDARRELAATGITQDEVQHLKLVGYWSESYPGRKPPQGFVAVFEIVPTD